MLDICYYNSQIKEELDGAADYIKRAINCKKKHPEWADLYAKMSDMELGHASNLIAIFEDDYKTTTEDISDVDKPIFEAVHKSLNDMYTEYAAKVKHMHDLYDGK